MSYSPGKVATIATLALAQLLSSHGEEHRQGLSELNLPSPIVRSLIESVSIDTQGLAFSGGEDVTLVKTEKELYEQRRALCLGIEATANKYLREQILESGFHNQELTDWTPEQLCCLKKALVASELANYFEKSGDKELTESLQTLKTHLRQISSLKEGGTADDATIEAMNHCSRLLLEKNLFFNLAGCMVNFDDPVLAPVVAKSTCQFDEFESPVMLINSDYFTEIERVEELDCDTPITFGFYGCYCSGIGIIIDEREHLEQGVFSSTLAKETLANEMVHAALTLKYGFEPSVPLTYYGLPSPMRLGLESHPELIDHVAKKQLSEVYFHDSAYVHEFLSDSLNSRITIDDMQRLLIDFTIGIEVESRVRALYRRDGIALDMPYGALFNCSGDTYDPSALVAHTVLGAVERKGLINYTARLDEFFESKQGIETLNRTIDFVHAVYVEGKQDTGPNSKVSLLADAVAEAFTNLQRENDKRATLIQTLWSETDASTKEEIANTYNFYGEALLEQVKKSQATFGKE